MAPGRALTQRLPILALETTERYARFPTAAENHTNLAVDGQIENKATRTGGVRKSDEKLHEYWGNWPIKTRQRQPVTDLKL